MAMEISHIWLGNFPTKKEYLSYMEETYTEDDDTPINQFSSDQGVISYDTDWEESFFNGSQDLKQLISLGSYSKDYINDALIDAQNIGIYSANTFIIIDKNEIKKPISIKNSNYSLTYLGEYKCDTSTPGFD